MAQNASLGTAVEAVTAERDAMAAQLRSLRDDVAVMETERALAVELERVRLGRERAAKEEVEMALKGNTRDADALLQELISTKIGFADVSHQLDETRQQVW